NRSVVGRLASEPAPTRAELLMVCQELRDFVAGVGGGGQRALLPQRDREGMAARGGGLGQAARPLPPPPGAGAPARAAGRAGRPGLLGPRPGPGPLPAPGPQASVDEPRRRGAEDRHRGAPAAAGRPPAPVSARPPSRRPTPGARAAPRPLVQADLSHVSTVL